MCVVSMIGDHYTQRFAQQYPQPSGMGGTGTSNIFQIPAPTITREEFLELRKDVLEMKELLLRAKKYDEENSQPHCEQEEKIALLRRMAEQVKVSLDEVFGPPK